MSFYTLHFIHRTLSHIKQIMSKQILLILSLFIISCNPASKKDQIVPENYINGIPKSVKQSILETKIILSEIKDPYELHLYEKIQFIINDKVTLEYKKDDLEIEGYQDNVCVFFQKPENGSFVNFYVFTSNNRPSPNKFIVFKQSANEIKFIGETEESTADIFGDVDLDGIFEIGGFNNYCQPGTKENEQPDHPLFCIEHLRVYEIGNTFERDSIMENFIKKNKNMR